MCRKLGLRMKAFLLLGQLSITDVWSSVAYIYSRKRGVNNPLEAESWRHPELY